MFRRTLHTIIAISITLSVSAAETHETEKGELVIHPINHATFVMTWNGLTIYFDPVGEAERFSDFGKPDLIIVTDIHGDHFKVDTLKSIVTENTKLVAPQAVYDGLDEALKKQTTIIKNGESSEVSGVKVEGVPMYNLTEERLRFHEKGRGNGYVLTLGGKRVYISGDTEDIPEMRALKDIDIAFVCMNLPYTMTVEQAADAVKEFKPKICYPYHHRGSDVEKFKSLVGDGSEVRILEWY